MKKVLLFLISFSIITFISCKENTKDHSKDTSNKSPKVESVTKYTLTPFTSSPEFPDAKLKKMRCNLNQFEFDVISDTYKLGSQTSDAEVKMCANSGKGQHIHLIVDNKPYSAQYTSSFEYPIQDGTRHVLAFLSRSYHESIKTSDAHLAKKVHVENNSIVRMADISDPMVFYSRPKGVYVGKDTKKVMLDFYLTNTELSENGNKVVVDINGEVHKVDKWQPYYIEGLPMGENYIKLSLVDAQGNLIKTPLNPVTRKFTLKESLEK